MYFIKSILENDFLILTSEQSKKNVAFRKLCVSICELFQLIKCDFIESILENDLFTSSHRIPYKHAIFCWNDQAIRERLNTHSDFCVFWPGALSTCHPWRAIALADVYTHNRFTESMGSRFGGPGQKALPAMNKFTLLRFFA